MHGVAIENYLTFSLRRKEKQKKEKGGKKSGKSCESCLKKTYSILLANSSCNDCPTIFCPLHFIKIFVRFVVHRSFISLFRSLHPSSIPFFHPLLYMRRYRIAQLLFAHRANHAVRYRTVFEDKKRGDRAYFEFCG